jgi:hypothetical protein
VPDVVITALPPPDIRLDMLQPLYLDPNSLQPIQDALHNHLSNIVHPFALQVNTLLLQRLNQQHHILAQIQSLNAFHLFLQGNDMHTFFLKLHGMATLDVQHINMHLFDLLNDAQGAIDASRVSVSFGSNDLLSIAFHYTIAWPLDLIVKPHHMAVYQRISQLLMTIKLAQHTATHLLPLTWNRRSMRTLYDTIHQGKDDYTQQTCFKHYAALRVALVEFYNSMAQYYLITVLDAETTRLYQTLAHATSVDHMAQSMDTFVRIVQDKCLLSPPVQVFYTALMTLFQMAAQVKALATKHLVIKERIEYDTARTGHVVTIQHEHEFERGLIRIKKEFDDVLGFVARSLNDMAHASTHGNSTILTWTLMGCSSCIGGQSGSLCPAIVVLYRDDGLPCMLWTYIRLFMLSTTLSASIVDTTGRGHVLAAQTRGDLWFLHAGLRIFSCSFQACTFLELLLGESLVVAGSFGRCQWCTDIGLTIPMWVACDIEFGVMM